MMPLATVTAEHSQVTAAVCQQKNTKSADHIAGRCRPEHSTFESSW